MELEFSAGESLFVEVAPPNIHGATVICHQDSGTAFTYFAEADHGKSHRYRDEGGDAYLEEKQFILQSINRACDSLELVLALGDPWGRLAVTAEVTRYGYHAADATWRKLNGSAPWWPDVHGSISPGQTGLSGNRSYFIWDDAWPQNYRFVADGLAGDYPSRQTVIDLTFGDGTRRSLVVTPF